MTSPKPFQATENPFQAINDPRNIYAVALLELQDLESKPVCHRTAAKLLVSDCQLLNGKSEATVHDSGRKARDFVDFYAAAMAICDLERGDFDIPRICDKFREGSLAEMATPERPTLHVSTKEIDGCLRGLARDTAAWSTWVSYRHKALAFCEAARTDYEKTEKIHLYQRLAEVLHGLTNEADASMRAFGVQIQEVEQRLSGLALAVDRLREDVQMADAVSGSHFSSFFSNNSFARQPLQNRKKRLALRRIYNNFLQYSSSRLSRIKPRQPFLIIKLLPRWMRDLRRASNFLAHL